jgi:NitT/TauT family transport system ATP-binding protein
MSKGVPKLTIQEVSRRFVASAGQVAALERVSLDVHDGEFVMLVGQSGCGKSTLLNIIAGLDHADSGECLIDGVPITAPGPDRALVFQDGALFPWLTVIQNVEFGLRQVGLNKAERLERARAYLAKVGLSRFENHSIHELSGGMRQRVALVRALVLEPKVLLMDEPFSELDALTREDLYGELQKLWSERNTTIVFVTHNVREAVTLGDRVVLMAPRPGRVLQEFTVGLDRPRQIDSVEVAKLGHEISHVMKGAHIAEGGVPIDGLLEEDPVPSRDRSSLGVAG